MVTDPLRSCNKNVAAAAPGISGVADEFLTMRMLRLPHMLEMEKYGKILDFV
jgi:hypothetical protein